MALTSLDYLRSRTAIPAQGALICSDADLSEGWSSGARKAIHEDYWGETVLKFVKSRLSQPTDFISTWNQIQTHEYLEGSTKGLKFARRQKHWARSLLGRPRVDDHAELAAIPFLPFLFEKRVEEISLRVMGMLRQQIFCSLIAPHVKPGTALFDLGSGWGRHALMFAHAFPTLSVHAGELSQAGQATTQLLADHFNLRVRAFGFNYLKWQDLIDRVRACPEPNIIIFSSHSIEQVTFVDKAMWVALAAIGKSITFLHVEPVGWQIAANSSSPYSRPPLRDLGPMGGYNKNLIAIADALHDGGIVRDMSVIADFIALGNVANSGTLLRFVTKSAE